MLNEELAADLAKFHKTDGFKIRKARVLQQIMRCFFLQRFGSFLIFILFSMLLYMVLKVFPVFFTWRISNGDKRVT